MRRLVIALCASLALAGCATNPLTGQPSLLPSIVNPVSETRLASIEASYGIALSAATAYIDNYRVGNRCTRTNPESLTNLCSRRSVVLQMQSAIRTAQDALGRARAFTANNPTLDASSVVEAAAAAVGALQALSARS